MSTEPRPLKVFLCHAKSDETAVRSLYRRLIKDGVDAWLPRENLIAGQEPDREIRKAVRGSDAVVFCLSKRFNQAGTHHRQARLALDTAMEQPDGEIFIIPARLEECEMPESLERYHCVDLFEEQGYEKLLSALKLDAARKRAVIPEARNEPVEESQDPADPTRQPHETPGLFQRLLTGIRDRQLPFDIRYLAIPSFLVALFVCLFGNNIYQQMTGHSIFADAATLTPTVTTTAPITLSATATDTLIPTNTLTPVPPTATQTLMSPTDTLVPTVTVVPPARLGEDWLAGCISTLWIPFPSSISAIERGDGCWKEPLHVFVAENGDLDFLAQRRNAPVEVYGLFAQLPSSGRVTVRIRLRELSNVDLWMGVFAEADIHSEGLLMIIPSGDAKKRPFVQKNPGDYETIASTSQLEQLNGYSISFRFTENSASSTVNPGVFGTTSIPIASGQKWLFLGYRGLRGTYRVDGTFLSFELE